MDSYCEKKNPICGHLVDLSIIDDIDICIKQHGPFTFVSGAATSCTPLIDDRTGSSPAVNNLLQAFQDVLKRKNCYLKDALLVHIYVKDLRHFGGINKTYIRFFTRNPPARVCVQPSLPGSCPLKIDCLSVAPDNDSGSFLYDRKALHVQSISHWAPANIGPYSQAVKYGPCTYVSGCIGLIPGSMKIVEGGIEAEAPLALRHVKRVIDVISPSSNLKDSIYGVCYVTSSNYLHIANYLWTQETQAEEEESKPLFQVLVVPNLPKSASIEWHLGLHSCEENNRNGSSSKDTECNGLNIISSWHTCPLHKMGYFMSSIGLSSDSAEINLTTLVATLHNEIKTCISCCESRMIDILSLRIFYVAEKFDIDEGTILDSVQKHWKETEQLPAPPVTLVPVQDIMEQSFLTVLGHVVGKTAR